jgi:LysM repeat protein
MGSALAVACMKAKHAAATTGQRSRPVTHEEPNRRKARLGHMRLPLPLLAPLLGVGSALTMLMAGVGTSGIFPAQAASAAGCIYYTVQSGDTLARIGAAYGSNWKAIAWANDIPNPNLIYPGQRFCVPQGGNVQGTAYFSSWQPAQQPAQQPVQQPAQQPAVASSGSVQGMIEQVFGANASAALAVAQCESGLNPGAYDPISVGGSHAAGVFQIEYPSTWSGTSESGASPYNAWANIEAAYQLSNGGTNWSQWTCQP